MNEGIDMNLIKQAAGYPLLNPFIGNGNGGMDALEGNKIIQNLN
ncbi:hypothetical protein [Dyadobacter sp. CY345]|nr:hypothetical protein [Dyadobacter sp. CY345]